MAKVKGQDKQASTRKMLKTIGGETAEACHCDESRESAETAGYTCKHPHKELRKIMDFTFYVCLECGYQWKA